MSVKKEKNKKGESDNNRAQRYKTLLGSLGLETHPEISSQRDVNQYASSLIV